MEASKRKALESAGWKTGDAADFLEMSDEERQLLDARVALALAIRQQRESPASFPKGTRGETENEATSRGQD